MVIKIIIKIQDINFTCIKNLSPYIHLTNNLGTVVRLAITMQYFACRPLENVLCEM